MPRARSCCPAPLRLVARKYQFISRPASTLNFLVFSPQKRPADAGFFNRYRPGGRAYSTQAGEPAQPGAALGDHRRSTSSLGNGEHVRLDQQTYLTHRAVNRDFACRLKPCRSDYGWRCSTCVAMSGQNSRNALVAASRSKAYPYFERIAPAVRVLLG